MENKNRIAFFGTPELAVTILDELQKAGIEPALIVTTPDKPAGRGMNLTPPPVKVWADENKIETLQPEKIDEEFTSEIKKEDWDLFVVFAYGKILPKEILDAPKRGTINLHPSLLPKLRGPSPIRSAILTDEKTTGVTIMLVDEEIDHGPILAQASVTPDPWPPRAAELEGMLMHEGGKLLAEVIPLWLDEKIKPEEQDHEAATYCDLFTKEDGLIDLNDDPYQNLLKIRAFEGWPGTHFYITKNDRKIRAKIVEARISGDGRLLFDMVIPDGKKEMSYVDFLQS